MPRRINNQKKYVPPDPVFKRLLTILNDMYKVQHHRINWRSCPSSIVKKVQSLIRSVCLPSPNLNLNEDLEDISQWTTQKLEVTAHAHFKRQYSDSVRSLDSNDFKNIGPKRFLEALRVIKRWAIQSYKQVNSDFLNNICHELNCIHHMQVSYKNGQFYDCGITSSRDNTCANLQQETHKQSFSDAHTQTLDSGYTTLLTGSTPGLVINHPPVTDFSEEDIDDYGIKLDHKVDVLVIATKEQANVSPEIVPHNWEIHCHDCSNPGPEDVEAFVSTMDGIYPDRLIIDLEPNDMSTEVFSENLTDLVSYCQYKFVDGCYFSFYEVSDSMNHNQRVNTLFHHDYLWNNHGSIIGPMNNHDMACENIPNYKLTIWSKYLDKEL